MSPNRIIPMSEWGHDHWSTLAYVETCVVDNRGFLDSRRMRGEGDRYPTRLRRTDLGLERLEVGHSDWDCLADFMAAGLAVPAEGTTAKGRILWSELEARVQKSGTAAARYETARFVLTPKGLKVAAALRAHKAGGGNFAEFAYPRPKAAAGPKKP